METKEAKFPWRASSLNSLELEFLLVHDELMQFLEAFAVHSTDELPMMLTSIDIYEFSGGKNLEVLITPSVIQSDESLKTLELTDRKCYFEGERRLKFFEVYTKRNCEIECFSNCSLKVCNCVPFDIIRDSDTRVCGIESGEFSCNVDLKNDFKDYRPTGPLASCSCLSLCDSVSYDIEIRESKFRANE